MANKNNARSRTSAPKHASQTSVSSFMGYLKGKRRLMIFDRHANLKYKYVNRQPIKVTSHRGRLFQKIVV